MFPGSGEELAGAKVKKTIVFDSRHADSPSGKILVKKITSVGDNLPINLAHGVGGKWVGNASPVNGNSPIIHFGQDPKLGDRLRNLFRFFRLEGFGEEENDKKHKFFKLNVVERG